jgi:hypothetical protein
MTISGMGLRRPMLGKRLIPLAPTRETALGNHSGIQPGVVADMARLHFRPFVGKLEESEMFQYGRASAPRG